VRRGRDALVLVAFLALLAGGLVTDALGDGVTPRSEVGRDAPAFIERGEYCPPGLRTALAESKVVAASPKGDPVPVGLQPALPQPLELRAGDLLVRKRTSSTGVDVVGYGAPVIAGAVAQYRKPVRGATAVRCAPDAAATWYFAEGSSEIGYDERIVLYNPFPAEAVARVTLFTPKGAQSKANLGEIAVHESSATVVALNDFVLRQPVLGASVEVARGRVVAWRVLLVDDRDAESVSASLGVDRPAQTWFLPNGEIDGATRQRISILNPTSEEAIVGVSLVTRKGVVQPPKLVDFVVRPRTVKALVLTDYLKESDRDLGAVSVIVRSNNEVPVVVEQTLTFSGGDLEGSASEVGAPAPGLHWAIAPPSTRPTTESLTIFNPGTQTAVASVTLVRAGGRPKRPADLQDVRLEPGGRTKLPIGQFTEGVAMMAFVDATAPVVADRFAYSSADGDVAAVGGERVRSAER
jgi:hypothetical protein